jgi:tetratricopeptide (TPR) repeat protein
MRDAREPYLRHATHYLTVCQEASALFQREGVAPSLAQEAVRRDFPQIMQAHEWACKLLQTDTEALRLCLLYPVHLDTLLFEVFSIKEQIRWLTVGAQAAQNLNDKPRFCELLAHCGDVHRGQGELDRARKLLERSLTVARELASPKHEALALTFLGQLYHQTAEGRRAIDCLERSLGCLAFLKQLPDPDVRGDRDHATIELRALRELAILYSWSGRHSRARRLARRALKVVRKSLPSVFEGEAVLNLGAVYLQSITFSRSLVKQFGDILLFYLGCGLVYRARWYVNRALDLARQSGFPSFELVCLSQLGTQSCCVMQFQKAIEHFEGALKLSHDLGNSDGAASALQSLGLVYDSLRQHARAITYFEQSIAISHAQGDSLSEGVTRHNLALALNAVGRADLAAEHEQAGGQVLAGIGLPARTSWKLRLIDRLTRKDPS